MSNQTVLWRLRYCFWMWRYNIGPGIPLGFFWKWSGDDHDGQDAREAAMDCTRYLA